MREKGAAPNLRMVWRVPQKINRFENQIKIAALSQQCGFLQLWSRIVVSSCC